MAVSDTELAAAKTYMRVDGDDDDTLIEALIEAAREYLDNGGIPTPEGTSNLYNLAVNGLTLHYYDHREAVGDGLAEIPLGLRSIINQLKLMTVVTAAATSST